MVGEILRDSAEVEIRLTHDLKSLFYVLLWICSNYSRPNNAVRDNAKHKHMPIMLWVDTVLALDQISNMKPGHILSDEHFNKWIFNYYPHYFEDIKTCSNELQCLFTMSNADVTHNTLLTILCRTLSKLPLEYDSESRKDHTMEDEEDIKMEEEAAEEEENSNDGMTIAQSGLGLNLRPLQFLPHTKVTHVLPWAAIMLYTEFLIKYYEYSFDYLIIITNQFTINAHT